MGKIYVPITASIEAKKAINKAISYAHDFNFIVDAIYVLDRDMIAKLERYRIFLDEESGKFEESVKKNVTKYLEYAKTRGQKIGVTVNEVALEGDTYDRIFDYIIHDNEKTKIICIAKKSGGELLKDIFSDLERRILLYSQFDILVIGEEI